MPETTLGDGGEAFFLGITDTMLSFDTTTVTRFDPDQLGPFLFDADAPEPGTLAVFGLGLKRTSAANTRMVGS